MQKPKVLNKHKDGISSGAVYVGRPSKWGNPYNLKDFPNREECINQFRYYLTQHPELVQAAKKELVGKDLVCFCAPKQCHADIWLEVANNPDFVI